MASEHKRSRWRSGVVVLVVLPVLYFLSIGPAIWLIKNGYIGLEYASAIYKPIEWLGDHSRLFRRLFWWCADQW